MHPVGKCRTHGQSLWALALSGAPVVDKRVKDPVYNLLINCFLKAAATAAAVLQLWPGLHHRIHADRQTCRKTLGHTKQGRTIVVAAGTQTSLHTWLAGSSSATVAAAQTMKKMNWKSKRCSGKPTMLNPRSQAKTIHIKWGGKHGKQAHKCRKCIKYVCKKMKL